MARAEYVTIDGAQSFRDTDDENPMPLEAFHMSDPPFQSGGSRRYGNAIWSRWLGIANRSRRVQYQEGTGDEGDELLHDTAVTETEALDAKRYGCCNYPCIYGLNTALSILLSLIILNLLFGFATFLQLDPLSGWGKPGTTSEGLSWYPTDFLRDVVPIRCHSHNDYWRKVPLFSALYKGCISVEADVWAIDNELYVGHNTASLTTNRTFQSLYINPLVTLLERQNPISSFYNGSGHGVFDTEPRQSLTLLVDLKSNGSQTWPLVLQQLEPLRQRGWLSYMEGNKVHRRPITVVGTGGAPFDLITSNQSYRDAFFDAPLDQMWEGPKLDDGEPIPSVVTNMADKRDQENSDTSATESYTSVNSYYASTSFKQAIGTIWWGKLSNEQIELIRGQVRGAHRRGLKVRYWNTPAWPTSLRNYIWTVFMQEDVDILNVDDLEAVRDSDW